MCRAVPETSPETASVWLPASSTFFRLVFFEIGLWQIDDDLSLGEINLGHVAAGKRHKHRVPRTIGADFDQIAGAEIRHCDDRPEFHAVAIHHRQPDKIMN